MVSSSASSMLSVTTVYGDIRKSSASGASTSAAVCQTQQIPSQATDEDSITSLLSDIQASYNVLSDPKATPKQKTDWYLQNYDKVMENLLKGFARCAGIIVAPILLIVIIMCMRHYQRDSIHKIRGGRHYSHKLPEILSQASSGDSATLCRDNAIVYFVEKESNGSYPNLLKSLDLLYAHYLNFGFYQSTHVMLFHLGDFGQDDLQQLEWRYSIETKGTIQLINLSNTEFWQLPKSVRDDDASQWRGRYSMHQRHKHRFFSNKIWDYFEQLNLTQDCNYRYIMKMEMDSFIYSDIQYNMHGFMEMNNYQYGYRLCSYEMEPSVSLWKNYFQYTHQHPTHHWDTNECAFYSNFFIADLQFMQSSKVQQFLHFIENGGYLYRHRINDSVIHTMIGYTFAPTANIHRFLDFTYEHFTKTNTGCPKWGALQSGYNDLNGDAQLDEWIYLNLEKNRQCPTISGNLGVQQVGVSRIHYLGWEDLSPTYSHLPEDVAHSLVLKSITAGFVDLPNMGVKSG